MQKNVKIKKILKYTVFKPLSLLNKILPKNDNIILLYSGNMGIRHNLKPLKEKLIAEQYYIKYTIVCGVENKKYIEQEEHIKYVTKMKAVFTFLKAKHVFYTAGQIPIKPSKSQIVIHMNHGTSDLKACGALSNIDNGDEFFFTYMLAPSELYVPIFSKEYLCPESSIKVCGEPMTDALFTKRKNYDLGKFRKKILWLPTFRQSSYLNYKDSDEALLPMFHSEDYEELNNVLKRYDFELIVKLHTAQDTEGMKKNKYSNIKIFTNDEFVSKGYDLYELMPQVDVLLGDYSSASLQFLLLNKPVVFIVPDMEDYKKNRGFCFDNPEAYMPGPIIKEKQVLYDFFDSLNNGKDEFINERKRVKDLIFKYQDGENSNRVLKLSGITK